MGKQPAFQFYPADWLNDIKLQACSIEAQGLLINLMCLMHQSEKYGFLLINGEKTDDKVTAKLLRLTPKKYGNLVKELVDNGALKLDKNGALYCRRMVADEELRKKRKAAGKLGGNPNLVNQKVKRDDNREDNQNDNRMDNQDSNQNPTPSSSSSSSSSTSVKRNKSGKASVGQDTKYSDIDIELADYLNDQLQEKIRNKRPATESELKKWADVCRLMRERDNRDPNDIREYIDFAMNHQNGNFSWRSAIQSMAALRKHWDKLTAQIDQYRGQNRVREEYAQYDRE